MSDPKIRNLEETLAPNKLVGPNKVDFPFHCNQENNNRAVHPSINPLNKNQLALIKTGGNKMRGKNQNENPSSNYSYLTIAGGSA